MTERSKLDPATRTCADPGCGLPCDDIAAFRVIRDSEPVDYCCVECAVTHAERIGEQRAARGMREERDYYAGLAERIANKPRGGGVRHVGARELAAGFNPPFSDDLFCYIAQCEQAESELSEARAEVERLREKLWRIREWTDRYGAELKPTAGSADTFGDGVRACKARVKDILAMHVQPSPDKGNGGQTERPERCPRCDSPNPKLHPAVLRDGEVQVHSYDVWKPEGAHVLDEPRNTGSPFALASDAWSDHTGKYREASLSKSNVVGLLIRAVWQLARKVDRLESEPAGAGSTQTGVCPNCGYAPVIALPPPELPDRTGKPLPDPLDQPVTVRELVEALRSTIGVNAASWEVAFQEMADRLEVGRES